MNCMDLFIAAVAVGLGFEAAKEFFRLLFCWTDSFWEDWRKPSYIFEGILLFLLLLYFTHLVSSTQLF